MPKKRWRRTSPKRHLGNVMLVLSDYASAPTLGRHLSNRCSMRSMTSVKIIPVIAKISTPTNTLSVWKVAPATVIMKPIPAVAAYSSPTMTPISARPTAKRKPVKMKGTVEGNTTDLKICHSEAPKLLAAVSRLAGVVFTPSRVLINSGKTAPRKIMPDLGKNTDT